MKRFFVQLVMFVIIIFVCDFAIGLLGNKLIDTAKGGTTKRQNYIANHTDEDVLVFGSSRAIHHYDPDILEDTLGLTVYNCGFDANGIICAYGYFKMVQKRYNPKVLVYEVTSWMDFNVEDKHRCVAYLRYFYGKEGAIDSIFWKIDKTERYKMFSEMYRFNSVLPIIIMDNIHPMRNDNKGYRPQDMEMADNIGPFIKMKPKEYDSLKLYYFERFIQDCKGKSQIIFTISPFYGNNDDRVNESIEKLCVKYGIPLLNHFNDSAFNNHREYFYDGFHLNRRGATAYSKVVAGEIKSILYKKE